ncbi:MAG: glycoside hydrolase family 16 protein [Bacteroidales bacterium]
MNRIFAAVCLVFLPLLASAQEYKLVWEDNFNGPVLNNSKWTAMINGEGAGNRELQYYRRENISMGREKTTNAKCLIITAKKEKFKGSNCTSGRLDTDRKMTFKYGKVEARIKLPKTANGLWPAFWMLGADHKQATWPKCGEIDIMEMGKKTGIDNGVQDRYFNGACHWGEDWNGGKYPNKGISTTNAYSLQDGFHTYTLFWSPDSIKMYLDLDKYPAAKPYYTLPIMGEGKANETSRYFRKPFYLIFNLAVGGTFSEIYDIEKITALKGGEAKMYVDYVRVYQKSNGQQEICISKRQ